MIEEIRRLPPNDPKLVALKTRNDDFQQAMRAKREEEEAKANEDRALQGPGQPTDVRDRARVRGKHA